MAANGKSNGAQQEQQETQEKTVDQLTQEVMQDWELAQAEPLEPQKKWKFKYGGRSYAFYKSVDWAGLWDKFNGEVIPKGQAGAGRRRWKSVRALIKNEFKEGWKRELVMEMIGPEPTLDASKAQLRVPYLGDWERRRRNGFYVFDDYAKAKAVQEAIEERKELIGATRALAPLISRRLAYWHKIRDMITEAYAGKLFEDDQSVMDPKQKKRVGSFLKMQATVEKIILAVEDQWMRVHGVNPMDPGQQWVTMHALGLGAQAGAAAALTGVQAVQSGVIQGRPVLLQDGQELPLPPNTSYDSILFAEHLRQHAEMYNLPLPETEQAREKAEKKDKKQKAQ